MINAEEIKKDFPILDSYCYNQSTPSRNGISTLVQKLFNGNSENLKKLKSLAYSDIFWDEIIDIEEINGEEWVYDLSVEDHHNFVANNIFAHNSNIADALCFVLGRLSSKSLRASKASNFLFQGTHERKPAHEAFVELIFDNSDKSFSLEGYV